MIAISAPLTPTIVACSLEESLTRLLKNRPYHDKLSVHAYAFRKDPLYATLKQRASDGSAPAKHWTAVRHNVGRLASWAKSTKSFMRMAQNQQFQDFLATTQCCAVYQGEAPIRNVIENHEQYSDLLKQVFPEFDSGLLQNRFKTCTSNDDSISRFIGHIHEKNPKPFVHAEMATLERTLSSDFTFAIDAYIACSKPPCYCCSLWARSRSHTIDMRPGHGNIYVKWAPPLAYNTRGARRLNVNQGALSSMVNEMRYTIQDYLVQGLRTGRKAPDSATDISTTLPSMQNLSLIGADLETSSYHHNTR
nr:hypothetical protein CFP56_33420 [Quercus suber]